MNKRLIFSILIFIGFMVNQCAFETSKAIVIPEKPYEKLSDYHFFTGNLADLQPNERVLPYDLNSPLFSDYAHKARFVWMPEGKSAQYATDHALDFPLGSVLIKNFYYENDETDASKGRRILETRLLIHRAEEWEAVGYIWNEEQTEAYYQVIGDIKEASWVNKNGEAQKIDYVIPNKNQCKGCHAYGEKQQPIGPKVQNLNKTFSYTEGPTNQLEKWTAAGYLSGYDPAKTHPRVAVWDDPASGSLHERAMAYLDINCGHCHNPKGAANTSGLNLVADAKMDISLGIYKATVSAGGGTGGHTYSIVPGNPDESIMVYRMQSLDPGAMMPELGRMTVHREGVDLISEWIEKMDKESVER